MSFANVTLRPGDNLAIDPGNIGSGWVLWRPDDEAIGGMRILSFGRARNVALRKWLASQRAAIPRCHLQVETPKPRGMPTSSEEMEMLIQLGRFLQMWPGGWTYVFRDQVKLIICGVVTAKDKNIKAALKDYFGGESVAVGGKKCATCKGKGTTGRPKCPVCGLSTQKNNNCPACDEGKDKSGYWAETCGDCNGAGFETPKGPLHGVAEHEWAALAVAVYWHRVGDADVRHIAGQQRIQKQKARWAKRAKVSRAVPG